MEDYILQNFGILSYLIIPTITATVTSVTVELLDLYTPKRIQGKYLLLLISIGISVLCGKIFTKLIIDIYQQSLFVVINTGIAVLFYNMCGKGFVNFVINTMQSKVQKKLGE